MKRAPLKGERLNLYGWAQRSRAGFRVHVECTDAAQMPAHASDRWAEKCPVTVALPGGARLEVTRGDLEPVKS